MVFFSPFGGDTRGRGRHPRRSYKIKQQVNEIETRTGQYAESRHVITSVRRRVATGENVSRPRK